MSDKTILSIIPESLHEDLIKEVLELVQEREKNPGSTANVNPDVKAFIAKQKAASEKEVEAVIKNIM